MMLIIMNENPVLASRSLVQTVPRQFLFKQLLELCQLVCSAGFSSVYKSVSQGKEIQTWIKKNPEWTSIFLSDLIVYCRKNLNMKMETYKKMAEIWQDISDTCEIDFINSYMFYSRPKTAIWRYKKSYVSKYPTNSELPIEIATKLYTDYITKFKFPRKMTDLYR